MIEQAKIVKTPYEMVNMIQKLPEQEQLRIEGIIVGIMLARNMEKPYTDGKRATK